MKRAFHATSVEIDPNSDFVGFSNGEASFWLQRQDGSEVVRPNMENVWIQCDDQKHGGPGGITAIELRPKSFVAHVDVSVARFMAPNETVEITFDDEGDALLGQLTEVLASITRGYDKILTASTGSGKAKAVPMKALGRSSELPRVKGAAALTLTAANNVSWSAPVGATLDLPFSVDSTGGPVHGLAVELGGPAITDGVLEAVALRNGPVPASPFTRAGGAAKSTLPHVRIDAGFAPADSNRRYDGRQPNAPITVRVEVLRAKEALLTVRVVPQNAQGSRGSALQGRLFKAFEG